MKLASISGVKYMYRWGFLFINFVFPSYVSSLGSFGGGQTLTVTGTGFNPQNSVVLVCGSKCAVNRLKSNRTTLLCEIPPNDGK